MADLQLGNRVPNFTLPGVTGEQFLLESHLEKHRDAWHVVVFFRGSWSLECRLTLRELEEELNDFHTQNLTLTAISADDKDALEQMVVQERLSFPVLSDEFFSITDAFGVFINHHGQHGEPASFILNEHGELIFQQKQTGPFGRPSPKDLIQNVQYIKEQRQKRGNAS
ncbi:Peroxiredoxin [Halobacillus dabanensis]|uniref:thioredoxin-dependent peroxiredoxin n=1 Tax=Halobacillus dabanensis TaxID=240302 RepID=A0A1I3Q8P3_HALDA|nr:redoxin domain-containing protein [Halobacillus dabanensis]SFJ30634.1 Peroxiredoxin [Halobacillus dabanensis]